METNRFSVQFLLIGTLLLFASFLLVLGAADKLLDAYYDDAHGTAILYGLLTCLSLLTIAFSTNFFVLAFVPISRHHTMTSALVHFFTLILLRIVSYYSWRMADQATKIPRQQQDIVLKRLLSRNADTEFGRKWLFDKITDREDYRRKLHLTTYNDDYKAYVDRLVKGEQNLLTKDPVDRLNVSSGTTGKCKLLPSPSLSYLQILLHFFMPYFYVLNSLTCQPFLAPIKTVAILLAPRWRYTEGTNMPIGPASAMTPKQHSRLITMSRTIPFEVSQVYSSEPAQLYLHWLFALFDPDVARLEGTFAGSLVYALEFLQANWRQLVADVRYGRVTVQPHTADMPQQVIARIIADRLVWPDACRADAIELEFTVGFDGIVKRLWPRIAVVSVCCTGAHAVYVPRLQQFCGPDVQLFSPFYGASEGVFGLNMDPGKQLFTLQPQMTFMEFIPEANVEEKQPATLFMDEVKVGGRYELVVTSSMGFYRYRIGDLVQVVGHRYGATPIVQFCSRVGGILDLRGEKTSEDMIFEALLKSCPTFAGCSGLVDFTTTECVSLAKALGNEDQQHDEVVSFDTELSEISYPYKSFRARGSIDLPKIFAVRGGTFQKLKELSLEKNQAISNQYKTPRYFSTDEHILFLISSSFS